MGAVAESVLSILKEFVIQSKEISTAHDQSLSKRTLNLSSSESLAGDCDGVYVQKSEQDTPTRVIGFEPSLISRKSLASDCDQV